MLMRVILAVLLAPAIGCMLVAPANASTLPSATLVQLTPGAACRAAAPLVRAGATAVAAELRLYRMPRSAASRVVPRLRAAGAVRLTQPDRIVGTLAATDFDDPLVPSEWWRQAVGVDTLTPPGPGKPVTIIDSGLDFYHPEFLERPNTQAMNAQEPAPLGGRHGTSVASLVGAPANGRGIVGIYPEAVLRSWDAAPGIGVELETSQIISGITAAANSDPGVINISLGGTRREILIEQAIYSAIRKGSLVVAASGNDGERGSPLGYPASVPHVLTVAATDRQNAAASFSSRSRFVDLAAPGDDIPIAVVEESEYGTGSGTSFAAPLVSGAAAWVWTVRPKLTNTQLFEVMRRSARDIDAPGKDPATGYGLLDVPAALAYPAPPSDPMEPNDDIDFVRPGGIYDTNIPPLTTRGRPGTTILARVDAPEDPRDVYRVWLPRNATFRAVLSADADLDLTLWRQGTATVTQRLTGRNRLARAFTQGPDETLTYRNTGPGQTAYLAVSMARGVREATYRMRITAG